MTRAEMEAKARALGLYVGIGPAAGNELRAWRVWPGTELRDWHEGGHLFTNGRAAVVAFLAGYEAGRAAR